MVMLILYAIIWSNEALFITMKYILNRSSSFRGYLYKQTHTNSIIYCMTKVFANTNLHKPACLVGTSAPHAVSISPVGVSRCNCTGHRAELLGSLSGISQSKSTLFI